MYVWISLQILKSLHKQLKIYLGFCLTTFLLLLNLWTSGVYATTLKCQKKIQRLFHGKKVVISGNRLVNNHESIKT